VTTDNTPAFLSFCCKKSFEGQASSITWLPIELVQRMLPKIAAYCIFPHVALCATQIKSSNMIHIWFFMQVVFG
jgi:hypothetical protein